jgi:hypothetical protein
MTSILRTIDIAISFDQARSFRPLRWSAQCAQQKTAPPASTP